MLDLEELKVMCMAAGLVRAIIAEVLGISAGALGGLHLVLSGPSAAARPSYQALHPPSDLQTHLSFFSRICCPANRRHLDF